MNSKTVCIKLTSGEDIFAELIMDDDESLNENFLKLYQPFHARIIFNNGNMSMMLSPWQMFSDDMMFLLQAHHVVTINTLNDQHAHMYGAMVTNLELKTIQNEISEKAKLGTLTKPHIDDALKETLGVLMKSGIKYKLPLPELDEVKTTFYSFLMGQYEDKINVTH